MAANKKQFSVENRVTFYICRQGDHYVREDKAIRRESDSRLLCPTHLKPLRTTPIEGILEQAEPLLAAEYKHALFLGTASGNIVEVVAGRVIKIHGLSYQAQGTVTITLNDGMGGAILDEWMFQARKAATLLLRLILRIGDRQPRTRLYM